MDEEKLRELLFELINTTTSIDFAIEEKKKDDLLLKTAFKEMNKLYNQVEDIRVKMLRQINISRLRIELYKLYAFVLNIDYMDMFNSQIEKLNETKDYFKSQKNLLMSIKNAIKRLEKYDVGTCNYDITVLLSLIFERDVKLIEDFNDYITAYDSAMNGITYISNKTYTDEIKNLDEQINTNALKLGLIKNKELGGVSDDIK